MQISERLKGLGVALATPFEPGGAVDFVAYDNLVDFMTGSPRPKSTAVSELVWKNESGGVDFLVVLGSTGEGATVEAEERRELIQRTVRRKSGLPIVVGTGSNSTAQTVRLTREAVSLGADAVLVVVPYYNKPTPEGLRAHYREVAAAAEGRPVIVYNVPGRTGLNLTPQVLSTLWEIPGVVAVKESSGNLAQIGEIARTLPAGKILLSGDDSLAVPAISLGAEGLISVAANVAPRRFKKLVDDARNGRRADALAGQRELLPLMDALFLESNPIPLKAALSQIGICSDFVRLPLFPASEATRQRLKVTLETLSRKERP